MTARRASFGGGAATWMRKRQTKETVLVAEPLGRSSTEKKSSANTTGSKTAPDLQVPASKTAKSSMVWDEERCRIVYEPSVPVSNKKTNNNATATATATQEEEEEDEDDNVSVDDDTSCCWETSYDLEEENEQAALPRVSIEKPADLSFPMQEDLNVVAVASSNTTTGKGRRGGKRSYASRKRMSLQSPPLNDAVLDVQTHHSRRSSKRIKRKLVDTEDGTSLHTTHTLSQESVSQDEEEGLTGETVSIEASQEETKPSTSPPVQLEPPSMFDFDDTEEKPEKIKAKSKRPKKASTQPSSKTSLEKAQCYFKQLDAKERLTLDSSRTPPSVAAGKACIRTRRHHVAKQVLDPTVLSEYKDYVTACQESGVAPRPVQSSFFRTNVIHDGFFDE